MAVVLTYGAGRAGGQGRPHRRPVRQAPQLADRAGRRPGASTRSAATWSTTTLPDGRRRVPDPERLVAAYHQSASTLNLLRAFTKGGFADLCQVHAWNQEFVASSTEGQRFEGIAEGIDRALRFMAACGIDLASEELAPPGRLLDQPRGADPRLRGGAHPPGLAHRRLVRLLGPHAVGRRADPPARRRPLRVPVGHPQPGRVEARPDGHPRRGRRRCANGSTRTGSPAGSPSSPGWAPTRRRRPAAAARAVRDEGHPVVWVCDPMHGNTFTAEGGQQDAPLRRHPRRAHAASSGPPRRGHLARRRPRGADRRRRHRVPRRRRRTSSRTSSTSATRRPAIPGSTPASRSTWPSASPSCFGADGGSTGTGIGASVQHRGHSGAERALHASHQDRRDLAE